MNKFNIQNYFPVLILVFFFASAAGEGSLIFPKFQESKILQENIAAKKEEIKQTEDYFKKLKEIKIQLETDYPAEVSKIDTALPFEFSVPSLLKFLQETSVQAGLSLKSVSPPGEGPLKTPALRTIKVALDVEGSYSAFKNFLSILENSSRLIEVEGMSFSVDESLKEQNSIVYSLQIETFSY